MRIAYNSLEEIPEGKRLLRRHRHRREDDICSCNKTNKIH